MPNDYMEVCNVQAKALWFQSPINSSHYYVALQNHMDYGEFSARFNPQNVYELKQAKVVKPDNGYDKWFMCYVEDCFDPPIAIVNAHDEQDAIDWFVEECQWARMSPEMVAEREKDGHEETIGWADGGHAYDNETMQCRSIKLIRIDC